MCSSDLVATAAPIVPSWSRNLYDAGLVRWQDPDLTACTASASLMMLNFVAAAGSGGPGFRWSPTIAYDQQATLIAWARDHDTLVDTGKGSDPHGWRNTLNAFGWGDFANPATMTYVDVGFETFDAALRATVAAIARTGKPVGILAWGGGHAQFVHGYVAAGEIGRAHV